MLGESGGVGEGFATVAATVGTLARVSPQVSGDRGGLRKAPMTHRTRKWLFPTVCSYVGRQIGRLRECFRTDIAPVEFDIY